MRSSFGGSSLATPSGLRPAAGGASADTPPSPEGIGGAQEGEVCATATLYTVTMRSDLPVVNGAFCMTISGNSLAVNVKSDMSAEASVLMARSLTLPPDAISTEVVSSFHNGVVRVQVARTAHGRRPRSKVSPGTGPVDTKALTKTTQEMMAELSNMLEHTGPDQQRFQSPNLAAQPESEPLQKSAADWNGALESSPALQMGQPASSFPATPVENVEGMVLANRTPRALVWDNIDQSTGQNKSNSTGEFTNELTNAATDVQLSPGAPAFGSTVGMPMEVNANRSETRRDHNFSLPPPSPIANSSASADSPSKVQAAGSDVLKRCQVMISARCARIGF